MKRLLLTMIAWATGVPFFTPRGRGMTHDVAFPFRMGAGSPGDVNRTHPASIEPCEIDADDPPTAYGLPVVVDAAANAVRMYGAGITEDVPWGVTVRPFPTQQASASNYGSAPFGSITPPEVGVVDVLRQGYIMVKIPVADIANAKKGSAVFVRTANSPGADDPVGGFRASADGGNTVALDVDRVNFNGPADASGVVELSFR